MYVILFNNGFVDKHNKSGKDRNSKTGTDVPHCAPMGPCGPPCIPWAPMVPYGPPWAPYVLREIFGIVIVYQEQCMRFFFFCGMCYRVSHKCAHLPNTHSEKNALTSMVAQTVHNAPENKKTGKSTSAELGRSQLHVHKRRTW